MKTVAIVACGSLAVAMTMGKTPDEIMDVTGEYILNRTGDDVGEENRFRDFLAAGTFKEALGV